MLALLVLACSTPLAQLRRELGPRAAEALRCEEAGLEFKELDRLISTTKVQVSGCGKSAVWTLAEGRWEKARPH